MKRKIEAALSRRENVNVHKDVFKTAQVEKVKFFSNLASVAAKSKINRLGGCIT